jgi:hypothetical protein
MPCRLPQKFGDNKDSPMACAVANFAGTSTFAMKQNKNVNNEHFGLAETKLTNSATF